MNSEENQSLLMKVLRQHYRDRPVIVDQAMKEISNYRNNPTKLEYERVSTQNTYFYLNVVN